MTVASIWHSLPANSISYKGDFHQWYIYRGYLNSTNNRIKLSKVEAENLSYFNKIKRPALDLISNQIHVELLEKPAREQLSISESA